MIHMAYPYDAATTEVQVRNPDLADHRRAEIFTAYKMSMTGKLYGRRKTVRPEILAWTFNALTRLKAQELRDFVAGAAGRFVRLIDHKGNHWKGMFAQDSFSFQTVGRGNGAGVPESVNVSFEFEGQQLQ